MPAMSFAIAKTAQGREQAGLLGSVGLEVRWGTFDSPETRASSFLREFGELLVEWPEIVEAARLLRKDGVRISIPI